MRWITENACLTSLSRFQDIIATFQDRSATLYNLKFMTNVLKINFEKFSVATVGIDYRNCSFDVTFKAPGHNSHLPGQISHLRTA